MEIVQVYKCMCDMQRLRILNLLKEGPLCVCHLVEILDADQVKISKQLRYMKENGMVKAERFAQWMIYSLADPENPLLQDNLKCLQDSFGDHTAFDSDMQKRAKLADRIKEETPDCACALEK